MKKHMTLGQMFDVVGDSTVQVWQRGVPIYTEGRWSAGYDASEVVKLPVYRISRGADCLAVHIGNEREKDDYDLTPTKDNMKSILDEAFGSWFESKKDDLIKDAIATGDYDDEIIERYLSDTEWSSIDEMTEYIDELRDNVKCRQEALEEIYRYAREYVD